MDINDVIGYSERIKEIHSTLKEDEELNIIVITTDSTLSTSYKSFMNIPEEQIIQIYNNGYKVFAYDEIKDLDWEVFKDCM